LLQSPNPADGRLINSPAASVAAELSLRRSLQWAIALPKAPYLTAESLILRYEVVVRHQLTVADSTRPAGYFQRISHLTGDRRRCTKPEPERGGAHRAVLACSTRFTLAAQQRSHDRGEASMLLDRSSANSLATGEGPAC